MERQLKIWKNKFTIIIMEFVIKYPKGVDLWDLSLL